MNNLIRNLRRQVQFFYFYCLESNPGSLPTETASETTIPSQGAAISLNPAALSYASSTNSISRTSRLVDGARSLRAFSRYGGGNC